MTKIIIVEDDPMIAEIYQKKFEESGFEVFLADSGEKALSLAKKEGTDAILLDIILPKMSGLDILKKIKTENYSPDIKVIMCSNMAQREDQDKARELGADGFIVKSEYSPSDLVKEVSRLLNQFTQEKKNGLNNNLNNRKKSEAKIPANNNAVKKILMIEDEEVFLEIFGEKLRQDGYQVDFSMDGAQGLKDALKGAYDLLVVDYMLPSITGEEIVAKLKLEDSTKNIPIVVLSASADDMARKRLIELGVTAFYVKTQIIPSELSNKVEEILQSHNT